MKVGAIDIGTNSMRLLKADYIDGNFINRKKFVDLLASFNQRFMST